MGGNAGQLIDYSYKEQNQAELGIFKPSLHHKATADELYQHIRLS